MPSASILVVDDEINMRNTLADILEGEGYDVCTAESGEKAVRMCAKRSYDLVLMDFRMPGIDGVEAFRRIRNRRSDVRVIMMSAYSTDALERIALSEGARAFLRKPLHLDRALRLIEDTCQ